MNLASILDGHPDQAPAVIDASGTVTFGALRSRVATVAGALIGAGAATGDRVAIIVPNGRSFVEAYFGALQAGLIAVPLNAQSPAPELERELAAVDARVVIASSAILDGLGDGRGAALLSTDDDGDHRPLRLLAEAAPRVAVAEVADDAPGVLLFTSGTAGRPRPATLTHANLLANIGQVRRHPGGLCDEPRCSLGVLPLHHVFGLNTVLGVTLATGGSVVLHDGLDPSRVARDIQAHGIDVIAGSPSMWGALLASGAVDPTMMRDVRFATSGAAHLSDEVAHAARDEWGVSLRQGYGLTEASPVVSSAVGTSASTASIGIPLPGVEVRVVDGGADALVDDEGEVWVRGPNVFAGYWNDAAATAATVTPTGWLRTGDIGVVDGAGHLYLVDRAKDLVIVSGFNVHPVEVEDVLVEHPAVAAAGVIGVPDAKTGEAVVAYVALVPGSVATGTELAAFCRERLARYKCPHDVEIVTDIPRGLNGKVLRRELRGGPAA